MSFCLSMHFLELPPSARGAKTQNFSDSNFLRAITFQTNCAKPFHTTSVKARFASHDIVKECVMNVPAWTVSWPHNPVCKAVGWLWPIDYYEIFRADFVDYAKGSKAVKALLEKEGRPATPGSNRFLDLQVSSCTFSGQEIVRKNGRKRFFFSER